MSKLLTSLSESDNKLSGEKEFNFLQTLLQSKEINALVNVHQRVAKIGKDDRIAPILSASMQVTVINHFKLIHTYSKKIFLGSLGDPRAISTTMSLFTIV